MKITQVEAMICDAGWRPWTFVKIRTDDGLTGYGECSDNRTPRAIAGCVDDLKPFLLGQDPRPVERLYWDMYRATRQSPGGIAAKAMAGIDCALWDIKAKALGVPVYELFGGPTRDQVRLYWSHCGTTRARYGKALGTPPIWGAKSSAGASPPSRPISSCQGTRRRSSCQASAAVRGRPIRW
jgi:L-alanine-DL-glutamate epimerase-like enolase superfamily enzyme